MVGLRGPVLAATDLSDAADAAIRQGHALAAGLQAPLVVCHVMPEAFRVRVLFPQDAGIDSTEQAQIGQKALAVVRGRLETLLGGDAAAVTVDLDTGTPHAGILECAERIGAGVIVVGPGATALRVARAAASPVLIARPSPTGGAVLAATDFSDPALPAVRMAAAEAARRDARFHLLHCLEIDDTGYLASAGLPGTMPIAPLPEAVVQQLEASARERVEAALAVTGVAGEAVVVLGPPSVAIVETARAVATALVVVGTRGRTGLARLALGSVAESVVAHAPCSVLVVPLHREP